MAKITLKKCPFCGGEAEIKKTYVVLDEARRTRCKVCGITTPPVLINHPKMGAGGVLDESTRYTVEQAERKAAQLWNARAT